MPCAGWPQMLTLHCSLYSDDPHAMGLGMRYSILTSRSSAADELSRDDPSVRMNVRFKGHSLTPTQVFLRAIRAVSRYLIRVPDLGACNAGVSIIAGYVVHAAAHTSPEDCGFSRFNSSSPWQCGRSSCSSPSHMLPSFSNGAPRSCGSVAVQMPSQHTSCTTKALPKS